MERNEKEQENFDTFKNTMEKAAEIISETISCGVSVNENHCNLSATFSFCDGESDPLEVHVFGWSSRSSNKKVEASVSFPRASDRQYCEPYKGYGESHFRIGFSYTKSAKAIASDMLKRGLETWQKENKEAYDRLRSHEEYLRGKTNIRERLKALDCTVSDENDRFYFPRDVKGLHAGQINSDSIDFKVSSLPMDKLEKVLAALA